MFFYRFKGTSFSEFTCKTTHLSWAHYICIMIFHIFFYFLAAASLHPRRISILYLLKNIFHKCVFRWSFTLFFSSLPHDHSFESLDMQVRYERRHEGKGKIIVRIRETSVQKITFYIFLLHFRNFSHSFSIHERYKAEGEWMEKERNIIKGGRNSM